MTIAKKILIGVTLLASVIFKVATKKIGPCSPEMEYILDRERENNREKNETP